MREIPLDVEAAVRELNEMADEFAGFVASQEDYIARLILARYPTDALAEYQKAQRPNLLALKVHVATLRTLAAFLSDELPALQRERDELRAKIAGQAYHEHVAHCVDCDAYIDCHIADTLYERAVHPAAVSLPEGTDHA